MSLRLIRVLDVLIIFGCGNHWISRTIQRSTNSKWSHVGIIDGDQVIESCGPPFREWLAHAVFGVDYKKPYGVIKTDINVFVYRYTETDIRYIDGNVDAARARLGMPFDMMGLICAYLKINWHDPKKDFCVETVSYAVKDIENHEAHKQTPKSIWLMSEPCCAS